MCFSMHADLEKLLSLGKITPSLAEKLDRIAPGRYCFHASWGAGKVISWNLPAKKLVIDFEENPEHEVALEFAPRILEFISDDHFLAKRYEDTESLINLSVDDPVELVRVTLQGYGNSLTPEKLEAALKGTVIAADKWKNWWDKVRAMLRSNVQFMMPTRKGERITLRANILSRAQAALEDYNKAADLKAKVRVLDGIKMEAVMAEPDAVNALIRAVDADVRNGGSLCIRDSQQVLELAVLRDDLIASLKNTEAAKEAYPLRSIVEANIGDVGRFAEVLNSMPAVRQKRVYATLPAIFGEDWPQKALELFDAGGARAVGEIAKFLIEEGQDKVLVKHLKHELLRQTLPAESLIWICRQRHDASKPLFGLPVGIAMLSLIEQDHMDGGPNRMLRLKNLFMEDKSIIQEMIKGQDVAEVRQFAKMLYNTSAFSEQDRGALMARIISVFPDLHAIVLDALVDNSDKPEPIFVSWESLEARKKELEELVNVKIPENLHNKKISRAEGDLRENGGYQDAKEVEKVLNRRRAELEHALALARGTDFAVTDTSRAAMGTKVTLQPLNGGEPVVYTILGAWDTNPEKHIVSYLSQVGKELTGNMYELNTELVRERVLGIKTPYKTIESIAVAKRPPALCPGCPHRGFFYTLSKNKNYVVTGDIGCYTLGCAAPLNCMDSVVCMGAGFSAGMGIAKSFEKEGVTGKVVFGVVGDSTFFHSGMTGAAEIVYNKGRMIPCVLDNRITGMTGHQDNPGTGYTLQGDPTALLSVEKILTALGFAPVLTVDPQDLKAMEAAVDQAVDALDAGQQPAIVTRCPCLLIKRDKFRKGMCRVNADKCRSCRSCLKVGCPAISLENGKAVIDRTQCVGCTVCAQVCPFDAIEKEEK